MQINLHDAHDVGGQPSQQVVFRCEAPSRQPSEVAAWPEAGKERVESLLLLWSLQCGGLGRCVVAIEPDGGRSLRALGLVGRAQLVGGAGWVGLARGGVGEPLRGAAQSSPEQADEDIGSIRTQI